MSQCSKSKRAARFSILESLEPRQVLSGGLLSPLSSAPLLTNGSGDVAAVTGLTEGGDGSVTSVLGGAEANLLGPSQTSSPVTTAIGNILTPLTQGTLDSLNLLPQSVSLGPVTLQLSSPDGSLLGVTINLDPTQPTQDVTLPGVTVTVDPTQPTNPPVTLTDPPASPLPPSPPGAGPVQPPLVPTGTSAGTTGGTTTVVDASSITGGSRGNALSGGATLSSALLGSSLTLSGGGAAFAVEHQLPPLDLEESPTEAGASWVSPSALPAFLATDNATSGTRPTQARVTDATSGDSAAEAAIPLTGGALAAPDVKDSSAEPPVTAPVSSVVLARASGLLAEFLPIGLAISEGVSESLDHLLDLNRQGEGDLYWIALAVAASAVAADAAYRRWQPTSVEEMRPELADFPSA